MTAMLQKNLFKIDVVLVLASFNAGFLSLIPYMSVTTTTHFLGYYLIFMNMPRRIIIVQLVRALAVNVTFSLLGYVVNKGVASGIIYFHDLKQ